MCEGEHRAFESTEIIGRINAVSAKARSADIPVIFIQHESQSGYLACGSDAWQLAAGLHAKTSELRIRKSTPDSFLRTELQTTLQSHAITDLVICCMHTEFCIDTTTRRALALGYPVTLIADAHTTEGKEFLTPQQVIQHHNTTLSNISSFGVRVQTIASAAMQFHL